MISTTKRFLVIMSVIVCQPGLASIAATPWYVSANAGIFQGMFDDDYNDMTDVIKQNIRQPVNQYGYTGGLAIGYSRLMSEQYFLGGELSGNFATENAYFASGASTTAFTDKLSIKGNVDLAFVPGLFITDTVAMYGKLGASYASVSSALTSPAGFDSTIVSTSSTSQVVGVLFGIGVKKFINCNTVIFSEYDYHDYGNVSFSNFQNFTATYGHSAHVYSQGLLIGASYLFA